MRAQRVLDWLLISCKGCERFCVFSRLVAHRYQVSSLRSPFPSLPRFALKPKASENHFSPFFRVAELATTTTLSVRMMSFSIVKSSDEVGLKASRCLRRDRQGRKRDGIEFRHSNHANDSASRFCFFLRRREHPRDWKNYSNSSSQPVGEARVVNNASTRISEISAIQFAFLVSRLQIEISNDSDRIEHFAAN